ncbi:MAG: hypothetical protein HYY81_11210 [Deltaproteobacteria bacterium]|nr:hypothetical protein [Deltaproteobacteria bacterium]
MKFKAWSTLQLLKPPLLEADIVGIIDIIQTYYGMSLSKGRLKLPLTLALSRKGRGNGRSADCPKGATFFVGIGLRASLDSSAKAT